MPGVWHKLFSIAATLVLLTVALTAAAFAQGSAYPQRKITFVVGFAPGGGIDTFARVVAQELGEQFGYQIVIENRPGSASNIAAQVVANRPDVFGAQAQRRARDDSGRHLPPGAQHLTIKRDFAGVGRKLADQDQGIGRV